jgi:hypothetical protein
MIRRLLATLALLCGLASAQSFFRLDPPVPGAVFRLCSITDSNPCSPAQPIYADQGLTQVIVQPVMVGQDGNYGFWTLPGQYILQISSPNQRTIVLNLAGPISAQVARSGISVAPLVLGFGSVQNGTNSQTQNATLTNTGTAQAIVINSANIVGNTDFKLVGTNPCVGSLAAGASCAIALFFNPTAVASESASLVINSSIAAPISVNLSGTGTAAATSPLTVTGTDTGFGLVASNDGRINCVFAPPAAPAGACGPINYTNGTPVTLTATANSGSTFNLFNGGSCSVSPCNLTIASPGFTITADFSSNAPATLPSAVVAPTSIAFGSVQTNTTSPIQNITISNTSISLPLTVNSVVFSGNADFSSSNASICNGVLPSSAACVVPVMFKPTAAVLETGTVTVNTNAPINPQQLLSVSLSGTGTATATFPVTIATGGGTGSGTVVSNEATPLISCTISSSASPSGQCLASYTSGATPTFTFTPTNGGTLGTVTGCTVSGGTCTPTISAAITITATFTAAIPKYIVNVAGTDQGTGTVTSDLNDVLTGTPINCTSTAGVLTGKCSATFNQGQTPTLTETPSGGCTGGACTFGGWSGVTGCTTASTCVLPALNANVNVSVGFVPPVGNGPLTLIQKATAGTGTNSITAAWGSAQTAGDFIACGALWNDATTTVSSVTDTKGNTYTQVAASPKTNTGISVVLYYAANIVAAAAGANTTTFALTASPTTRKPLCIEYSGVLSAPADGSAGSTGTGTAVSSGALTTTVASDLLVGVDVVGNNISAVSTGFTQQILVSGNDYEDRQATGATSYTFAPTQATSTVWAAILGAFKTGGTSATFSVNLACAGAGSGTVSIVGQATPLTCTAGVPSGTQSVSVSANSTLTLNAVPSGGSVFFLYNGAGCGSPPSCVTNAITTNTTITATFNLSGVLNYFVRTDGNDANNGLSNTAGGAWLTINHAASALTLGSSGTTVNVAAGTYNGCVTTNRAGTATQPIVYLSTTALGAHIVCSNGTGWFNGTNLPSPAFVTIKGFDITATGTSCYGLTTLGDHNQILNNYVHDVAAPTSSCGSGIGGAGILTGVPSGQPITYNTNTTVIGNIVDNVGFANGSCATQHGIYLASELALVENNIVSRACGWGIESYGSVTSVVIANNTVLNNLRAGIGISSSGVINDHTSVFNNIVVNNGGVEYGISERYGSGTGPNNTYRNNLLVHNLPANFNFSFGARTTTDNLCDVSGTACATVISASQALTSNIFVNYTGNAFTGDYHLKAGSVAIGAGSTGPCAPGGVSPCTPTTDFAGNPVNAPIDIGAYKF